MHLRSTKVSPWQRYREDVLFFPEPGKLSFQRLSHHRNFISYYYRKCEFNTLHLQTLFTFRSIQTARITPSSCNQSQWATCDVYTCLLTQNMSVHLTSQLSTCNRECFVRRWPRCGNQDLEKQFGENLFVTHSMRYIILPHYCTGDQLFSNRCRICKASHSSCPDYLTLALFRSIVSIARLNLCNYGLCHTLYVDMST